MLMMMMWEDEERILLRALHFNLSFHFHFTLTFILLRNNGLRSPFTLQDSLQSSCLVSFHHQSQWTFSLIFLPSFVKCRNEGSWLHFSPSTSTQSRDRRMRMTVLSHFGVLLHRRQAPPPPWHGGEGGVFFPSQMGQAAIFNHVQT